MGSGPRAISASGGSGRGRNPRAGPTKIDISVFRYRNVDTMWPFAWKMHGRRGLRRPQGIPEMVSEMEGYVSYFEDVKSSDASKLQPHREAIEKIARRLQAVAEGGGRA